MSEGLQGLKSESPPRVPYEWKCGTPYFCGATGVLDAERVKGSIHAEMTHDSAATAIVELIREQHSVASPGCANRWSFNIVMPFAPLKVARVSGWMP